MMQMAQLIVKSVLRDGALTLCKVEPGCSRLGGLVSPGAYWGRECLLAWLLRRSEYGKFSVSAVCSFDVGAVAGPG